MRHGQNIPRGTLRITVGTAFGNQQLLPALPSFMRLYPDIKVALSITDHLVDIAAEGFDLGLRLGPLGPVDNLVARRIATLPRKVCASPAYLRQYGEPAHPEQLNHHQCLTVANVESADQWPFLVDGKRKMIDVGARLSVDSAESLLSLALAGGGIVRQSAFLLESALLDGRLVEILQSWRVDDAMPLTALYPPGRQHQAKLTAMLEFLQTHFGNGTGEPASRTPRQQT
jgi:DNA-binding transcriptional LysR family regulator